MNQNKLIKKVISFLVILSIVCELVFLPGKVYMPDNVYASERSEVEYDTISGTLYSMGYEYDVPREQMMGTNVKVRAICDENQTITEASGKDGTFTLKVEKGKIYRLYVYAYISARIATMNLAMDNIVSGSDISIAIRTKNVPGYGFEANKYPFEADYEVRDMNYVLWQDEAVLLSPDYIRFALEGDIK